MDKFEIDDIDVFNYVNWKVSSLWDRYSGIHDIVSLDDFVQDILLTLYDKGRDGVPRIEKYKSKGEEYFYNVIAYMIRIDLVAYTKPKWQDNRSISIYEPIRDCENLTLENKLVGKDEIEDIHIKYLVESISNKQIGHYVINENGNVIPFTQRILCKKVLEGFKCSELAQYIYNEVNLKEISHQCLYNVMSKLRKEVKEKLDSEKKGMMLNVYGGRKYTCRGDAI